MEKSTNGPATAASSWFKNDHFGSESDVYSPSSSVAAAAAAVATGMNPLSSANNAMGYNCLDYQFFTNAYASHHHYHTRTEQDSPPHSSADSCDKSSTLMGSISRSCE